MTKEIISKLFNSLDSNDYESAAQYLHDDFKLTGPFPEPQNKESWLGGMKAMSSAFPDWKFNATDFNEAESGATFYVQISATHKGELMVPNGPTVPATNKEIAMPKEMGQASFKDGKILNMDMHVGPDGGMPGILKQLGFKPPA